MGERSAGSLLFTPPLQRSMVRRRPGYLRAQQAKNAFQMFHERFLRSLPVSLVWTASLSPGSFRQQEFLLYLRHEFPEVLVLDQVVDAGGPVVAGGE